jgi:hypothetical protein
MFGHGIVPLIWAIFVVIAIVSAMRRRAAAAEAARKSALEVSPAERVREMVEELQRQEAADLAAGWRPPTGPATSPAPNIKPRVLPTGGAPYPMSDFTPAAPPPADPHPRRAPEIAPSTPATAATAAAQVDVPAFPPTPPRPAATAPSDSPPVEVTPASLVGPQVIDLPLDLQRRALELMKQHYEVGAVRLICDETGAGILDAQKTVRSLAGLPTL